jgi:tetratricopeptide (TPR) repeat protein
MKNAVIFASLIATLFIGIGCKPGNNINFDELSAFIRNDTLKDAVQTTIFPVDKYLDEVRAHDAQICYYNQQKAIREAQEYFEKYIMNDPRYSKGYQGLAWIYEEKGMYDCTQEFLFKAIESSKDKKEKAANMCNLANLYIRKMKDYQTGIDLYKLAIELVDSGDYFYGLGLAYYSNNQKKEAEEAWLKALQEKSFTQRQYKHSIYYQIANYYFKIQDYKKSKEYIEKAIHLSPYDNEYVAFYNGVKNYVK